MGFFGFKSSKEVEAEKIKAAADALMRKAANGQRGSSGQMKFAIPYFDVVDPRLMDVGVPISVHGEVVYVVEDLDKFQSLNNTEDFYDDTFRAKLKATIAKFVKSVVCNIPCEEQIPVVQLERKIMDISMLVQSRVVPQVEPVLGVTIKSIDITDIIIDKTSQAFKELNALTADLGRDNILAQHKANLSNFNLQNQLQQDQLKMQLGGQMELQAMQLENQREIMRIQREEMQRAARLQTEQTFLDAHQANLGASQPNNSYNGGMGGAPQMPQMGVPPMAKSAPQVQYMVGVNGQQAGPFDWNQLQQLVQQGMLTAQSYVWKQGMLNWEFAGNVAELAPLFGMMPGMPPMR